MKYNGFGAWCAAYAFLNTVGLTGIIPETYELLSGVPFGLKHRIDDPYRILTPWVEPCFRVEAVATMLGYTPAITQFDDMSKAVSFISQLPSGSRIMIGPVDMGFLTHLPQNLYYRGQSHYFSVEVFKDRLIVIDSEGTLCFSYNEMSLIQILNVKDIPESNGILNIWKFEKSCNKLPQKEYKRTILKLAASNMEEAEDAGQGSRAITACIASLAEIDPAKWYLSLFFELNFVIQRKHLFWNRLCQWGNDSIRDILEKQLDDFCKLREQAMGKKTAAIDLFKRVADYEQKLTRMIPILADEEDSL